jgi:hypothetical protein
MVEYIYMHPQRYRHTHKHSYTHTHTHTHTQTHIYISIDTHTHIEYKILDIFTNLIRFLAPALRLRPGMNLWSVHNVTQIPTQVANPINIFSPSMASRQNKLACL